MEDEIFTFIVSEEESGQRLDSFLAQKLDNISRSRVAKLLDEERVSPLRKASYKVCADEEYCVSIPPAIPLDVVPEDIPLDILYEDSDVIVVNKPKGMVVHPDNTHITGTMVNALLYHCHDLSGIGGVMRPGIVHRIDMDTTGAVIACKNDLAHESIAAQLKAHTINRKYIAIVNGNLKNDEGAIDAPLGRSMKDRKKIAVVAGGKRAVTHYKVLERFKGFTMAECVLETGRTHQIRVHMAHIGHSLLGDEVYGNPNVNKRFKELKGQCLHAMTLGFLHPVTGEYIETNAPIPEYFEKLIEKLRNQSVKPM